MTETQMYQSILLPWFRRNGFFSSRIEQAGMPDTMVIRNGFTSLCELKVISEFKEKQKIVKPEWRTGQLAWISWYQKKGGDAWLILYYKNKAFFLRPKKSYTQEELICQRQDFLDLSIPKQ